MFNNNQTSSNNRRGELVQNNRFECLNESYDSQTSRTNNYSGGRGRNNDSYENRFRRNRRPLHSERYSFLADKKAPKKKTQVNLKTTKFPSLIDLKKIKTIKVSTTSDDHNYKVAASYTEEQLQEIQKEKEKQKNKKNFEGWVQIENNNGQTIISELNKHGKKKEKQPTNNEDEEEEYDHKAFQIKCAESMYENLRSIQSARDEENEILGPHSRYYNKGSLIDLSYISDSDVESSDDEDKSDNDANQEYYSDYETY